MVQLAFVVVQPKQKRTDNFAAACLSLAITKPANHAIRATMALDLLHAVVITALVKQIETLGDDAIAPAACGLEPFLGVLDLAAGRRQTKKCSRKAMLCERLQFAPTLPQRYCTRSFAPLLRRSKARNCAGVSSDNRLIRLAAG